MVNDASAFFVRVGPHPHALYALRATFGLAVRRWIMAADGLVGCNDEI
jgi:hypothetical protein